MLPGCSTARLWSLPLLSLDDYFTPLPPPHSSNLQHIFLHPNFLLRTLSPISLRKWKQQRPFTCYSTCKNPSVPMSIYSSLSSLVSHPTPTSSHVLWIPFFLTSSKTCISHCSLSLTPVSLNFPSLLDHSHQHRSMQLFSQPKKETKPSLDSVHYHTVQFLFCSLAHYSLQK